VSFDDPSGRKRLCCVEDAAIIKNDEEMIGLDERVESYCSESSQSMH
jgi:hypothetical protein